MDPRVASALLFFAVCSVVLALLLMAGMLLRIRSRWIVVAGLLATLCVEITGLLKHRGVGGLGRIFRRANPDLGMAIIAALFALTTAIVVALWSLATHSSRRRQLPMGADTARDAVAASRKIVLIWIVVVLLICGLYSAAILWLLPQYFPALDPEGARNADARAAH